MKRRAAMPSGSKPLPASQERQKRNTGIGDCSKSAEKESKRGSKSQLQVTDSGNLPNTLSATPEAEVSRNTEARVSQGAGMNQGEWKKCEGRGKKLNPEKVLAGQASIFDISGSKSETEGTLCEPEPGNVLSDLGEVHKLADEVYKPFGSRSRTGSTADSDGAFCKGGPSTDCGKAVGNKDEALQCDRCDRWYHCACQGVPSATYRVAGLHKALSWLCTECKASIRSPSACCTALKEKVKELEATMQSQLEKLISVQGSQSEKLIRVAKEQAAALENSLQAHMHALKQASTEQAEILASEQAKLSKAITNSHKQLTKDHEKQKLTYADIIKNQCHEVLSPLESQIENLPNSSAPKHAEPPGAAKDVAGILDTYMEKERHKCSIVVQNLK